MNISTNRGKENVYYALQKDTDRTAPVLQLSTRNAQYSHDRDYMMFSQWLWFGTVHCFTTRLY